MFYFCNGCMICTQYGDVIMAAMASKITGVLIVYSTVCSGADQRKHQSLTPLAFVRGIHRWQVNSPHIGPVTRKMFPFADVIMHPESCPDWPCCSRTQMCFNMWSTLCFVLISLKELLRLIDFACKFGVIQPFDYITFLCIVTSSLHLYWFTVISIT